ncbi:MAG: hypothetical protein HY784_19465, partial [Chloroflexi bacterium]|nr:hypothetical protein [Chloroflexota bacterium]
VAPFRFQFRTGSYSLGPHTLSAAGRTADGQRLTSNEIHTRFVSPEVGNQSALRILIPLFGVIILAVALAAGGPWLLEKITGKKRTRRGYGLMGGAICPKCGQPFGRHWWPPNMLLGKLDRCPHCGKWSVVRAASPDTLRAAEQAGEATAPEVEALTPEERLRRQVEDSRFDAG